MTAETSNARGEWVLVPRVPTEEMVAAGMAADINCIEAYNAMLAAVPALAQQPAPSAPVGVEVRREIERAIQRARVFDDGSDGADAESAQSVVAILEGVLAQQPAAVDSEPDCPHSALDGCDCYATQHQEPKSQDGRTGRAAQSASAPAWRRGSPTNSGMGQKAE